MMKAVFVHFNNAKADIVNNKGETAYDISEDNCMKNILAFMKEKKLGKPSKNKGKIYSKLSNFVLEVDPKLISRSKNLYEQRLESEKINKQTTPKSKVITYPKQKNIGELTERELKKFNLSKDSQSLIRSPKNYKNISLFDADENEDVSSKSLSLPKIPSNQLNFMNKIKKENQFKNKKSQRLDDSQIEAILKNEGIKALHMQKIIQTKSWLSKASPQQMENIEKLEK